MRVRQGVGFRSAGMARHRKMLVLAVAAFLVGGALGLACGRDRGEKDRSEKKPASGTGATGGTVATPASDPSVEKIVLARAGKTVITVKDVDNRLRLQLPDFKDLTGPSAVRQKWEILLNAFEQALWVEAGERRGFDKDPEFRDQLELSRQFILARLAQKKLVSELASPTDEEIKKYYDDNIDRFSQPARALVQIVLVPTRPEAEALRRRAAAGEDFSELARRYSKDGNSAAGGGNIGPVGMNSPIQGFSQPLPALNQAIFATPVGQVTPVLETERGACFFRVNDRSESSTIPLDNVRPTIVKWLTNSKTNEASARVIQEVKKQAKAEIDTTGWRDYAFKVLTEDEVFQLAEGERTADRRIGWFRSIAEHYPESPRAPQALFLAGFSYAEDLKDYPRAAVLFKKMLEKYPQSDLASSAKWMIDNMDKGLENLPYADQLKRRAYGS